jgi:sensor histidine kinase regulating citrate/malate metabolism
MCAAKNITNYFTITTGKLIFQPLEDYFNKNNEKIKSRSYSKILEENLFLHDVKNLLFSIYGYINAGCYDTAKTKILEYDRAISNKRLIYTYIDNLIASKIRKTGKLNIFFHIEKNITASPHILPSDMSTILGNILDNAIEANLKIKNASERWLRLKITVISEKTEIIVSNAVNSKSNFNPKFTTTKYDSVNHGLGMQSIKKTVKKNNGKFFIRQTPGNFYIAVVFKQKVPIWK